MDKNNEDTHTLEQERAHTEIGAKYAKLSVKGAEEYRNLQYSAIKQFGFWVFVGSFGGLILSKFLEIPFKNKPQLKLRRYKTTAFFVTLTCLSYHGYKLSRFHFVKGKKRLLADPTNTLEEPADYTN